MDPAAPLSSRIPSLISCTIPQLLAFPTSLAVLKTPILWNASCWVADRRLDEFETAQIALQQGKAHIEWCHFASDRELKVSLLVVFPHLDTGFRQEHVMEKWTDEIALPCFKTWGLGAGVLSQSWRIVRMTAEAEREETLNINAPDTPLREFLTKRAGATQADFVNVWADIATRANSHASGLFRDLFLVAVCHMDELRAKEMSVDESWREISSVWDRSVDMNYVPVQSVRAHAKVTIGVQDSQSLPCSQATAPTPSVPTAPVARKRKVDDQNDGGKRSRFDESNEHSTRPWLIGRSHTTPMTNSELNNSHTLYDGTRDDMEL